MKPYRSFAPLLMGYVCLLFFSPPAAAQQWKPIDPSHLSLKTPVVEKDAGLESPADLQRVDLSERQLSQFEGGLRHGS
jgi:hypothetical protein